MEKLPKTLIEETNRILQSLSPREEKVLRLRFGLGAMMSDEIASRAYGRLLTAIFGEKAVKSMIQSYRPAVALTEVVERVTQLTPELIDHLKRHHQAIDKIPWNIFEHLIAEFFAAQGYDDVRLVGRDRATSADIYASHTWDPLGTNLRFFVEVKRIKGLVGVEVINEVLGAMFSERPTFGWHAAIIVSTGGFRRLRKFSKHELSYRGLELKDRNDLLRWLHNYRPNKNGLWLPYPLTKAPRLNGIISTGKTG
jgi:HJR/Mrr/RecB family endonuclease